MKTIGLIGGTTWISTVEYYRIVNQVVNERLGNLSSAKLLLYSVNYQEFKLPAPGESWERVTGILTGIAKKLEHAGADCILLCANTTHMVADIVQQSITVPLIHIAEETGNVLVNSNMKKVALLGTKFTMEQSFFKDRLKNFGIETLIPDVEEREFIHATIFNELGLGIFKQTTRERYISIIERLKENGAEGVVFGCTEIPMLIKQGEAPLPIFDTLRIHATAAVDFILKDEINNK